MTDDEVIDAIFAAFAQRGSTAYLGEPVSLTEHMLQTALAAEQDCADPVLVASALLHDYGHLVHELSEDSAEHGVDTLHEEAGAAWLEEHFVPRVTSCYSTAQITKPPCASSGGPSSSALTGRWTGST